MIQDSNAETIHNIKNQLNRPFERTTTHYWDRETQGFITKTIKYSNPVFSFYNIFPPTDLEAYDKQADYSEPAFSGNDWYSFNNREWGTKWDVAKSDEDEYSDTSMTDFKSEGQDHWVGYRFDTAWAPPIQAMIHLSKQYPTAVITLSYQEEQGWGGEVELVAGEITSSQEYESQCMDCDAYDCLEYCDDCDGNICSKCNWLGEIDLEYVKDCPTHKIYLDSEHVPDYRMEQING